MSIEPTTRKRFFPEEEETSNKRRKLSPEIQRLAERVEEVVPNVLAPIHASCGLVLAQPMALRPSATLQLPSHKNETFFCDHLLDFSGDELEKIFDRAIDLELLNLQLAFLQHHIKIKHKMTPALKPKVYELFDLLAPLDRRLKKFAYIDSTKRLTCIILESSDRSLFPILQTDLQDASRKSLYPIHVTFKDKNCVNAQDIDFIFTANINLISLDLTTDSRGIEALIGVMNNPCLEYVTIHSKSGAEALTDEALARLLTSLKAHKSLSHLHLDGCTFQKKSIHAFNKLLFYHEALKSLKITSSHLNEEMIDALQRSCVRCTALHRLSIDQCQDGSNGKVNDLIESLITHPSLIELNIGNPYHNRTNEADFIKTVCHFICSTYHLKKISVGYLNDAQIVQVLTAAEQTLSVKVIKFEGGELEQASTLKKMYAVSETKKMTFILKHVDLLVDALEAYETCIQAHPDAQVLFNASLANK